MNEEDVFVALLTGYSKFLLLHVAAAVVRQPSKESVQLDHIVCVTAYSTDGRAKAEVYYYSL